MKLCPKCREKIVPIVYGFPAPETFEKAERKEVSLGGCMISEYNPKYHCYNCNRDYYEDLREFIEVKNWLEENDYDEDFDLCITSKIGEQIIDYGIIFGEKNIVIVKSGQDGSYRGFDNKYLKMAKDINNKYGYSVICCSNPFDGNNPLDDVFKIIKDKFKQKDSKKIYYIGYSNGALIGAWFGNHYKIDKMVLVNGPLMFNYHKTKDGANNFTGTKMTFVYGDEDQSIKYTELLKNITNKKVKIEIVENEDHHFSKNWEDFYSIPEKYLFDDTDIKIKGDL